VLPGAIAYFGVMKVNRADFCILLLLPYMNAAAQNKVWPPPGWADTSIFYGSKHLPPRQNVKGYMILYSGDSLTGYMNLNSSTWFGIKGCEILEPGKFSSRFIFAKKIKYIRADIGSLGHKETELVTLDVRHSHQAFWRLIGQRGEISIYDRSTGIFWHTSDEVLTKYRFDNFHADAFNEYMYMVTETGPVKIYGKFGWGLNSAFVRNHSLELLIKFINRRYHQAFKVKDFASGMAMINYILDKENELTITSHSF
jgi:hypothetical protein